LELSKTFEPKAIEERWTALWETRGYFVADPSKEGRVHNAATGEDYFSIVIPPPNVTGQLHLGHALNATLQDVIVRMRRMQGFNTLWLVGTDHAGIATQNVVERELAKENRTRHDLGRDAFVARVWAWREAYGRRIIDQLRKLGSSCDFSRERFTLDPGLSRAVITVFTRLYKDGLIYRDRRLINWCPRCETALSELEVDHRDTGPASPPALDVEGALSEGKLPSGGLLYYIKYPLADGSGALTVATTRPETMLGDTAVAINPSDERCAELLGRRVILPLTGREIPLIADEAVEAGFGTGVVKVTPAHDFADFAIARRHGLEEIAVIDARGRMTDQAGPYKGLRREEARARVLEDLRRQGLLTKIEPHRHALGVCSRCETVLEPMLSWQWFVRIKTLAEKAIEAVRAGRTRFYPKHWENTYFNWLENVHDWCISRQLWWGHRIPAYWCARCGQLMVEETKPEKCSSCGCSEMEQEKDVLDTWFSSALWPFSTLGWPDSTPEFKRYYPTSLLVTGFDIIFFWVARMMMMGIYFTGDVPFREVYITPLVRDQYGKKMTKSRGNVIDPLVIMDTYGTDAVRFTLAQLAVQGRDLILSADRLAASKAFANKIWNAARFVLMNLEGTPHPVQSVSMDRLSLADRWILDRLSAAIDAIKASINRYEFNAAAMTLYQFIWHEFCDWYIELAKEPLKQGGEARAGAQFVLVRCLDSLLRLLHPFMPFLTEELWQAIRPYVAEPDLAQHLAVATLPVPAAEVLTEPERGYMSQCIAATRAINSLRSLVELAPGQQADVFLRARPGEWRGKISHDEEGKATRLHFERQTLSPEEEARRRAERTEMLRGSLPRWERYARALGRVRKLTLLGETDPKPERVAVAALLGFDVFVRAPENFDFGKHLTRLRREEAETQAQLDRDNARLADVNFRAKASAEEKEKVTDRYLAALGKLATIRSEIAALSSGKTTA
jgi:valyl-tRNA synthetase